MSEFRKSLKLKQRPRPETTRPLTELYSLSVDISNNPLNPFLPIRLQSIKKQLNSRLPHNGVRCIGKRRFPRWKETNNSRWEQVLTLKPSITLSHIKALFPNIDMGGSQAIQNYHRDEMQLLAATLYMRYHTQHEPHALTLNLDNTWEQHLTKKEGVTYFHDTLRKLLKRVLNIESPLFWYAIDTKPDTQRLHIQGGVNLPYGGKYNAPLIAALEEQFGKGLDSINPATKRRTGGPTSNEIVKLESIVSPEHEYKRLWCWPAYCLGDSQKVLAQLPHLKKTYFIAEELIEPSERVYDWLANPKTPAELPFAVVETPCRNSGNGSFHKHRMHACRTLAAKKWRRCWKRQ